MRASALVVATATAGWLWCAHADACSIGQPAPELELVPDGATDVPTNPRLWLADDGSRQAETLILRAPDGTEIPLTTTTVGRGFWRFLVATPSEELSAHTRYEVASCTEGSCGSALRSFTTGDGPDSDPPPLPEEVGRESGVDRMVLCGGNNHWVRVDLAFEGLLVLDLDVPEFDEESIKGSPDWITTDEDEPLEFGDLGFGFGSPVLARVGAFDEAGNFSGWVQLDPIEVGGCGCRSDPQGKPAGRWAWLVLSLAAIRRSRRRWILRNAPSETK